MALLGFDGFDHYNISANTFIGPFVLGEYITEGSIGGHGRIDTMPELGTLCYYYFVPSASTNQQRLRKLLGRGDTSTATYGVGFHLYSGNLANGAIPFCFTTEAGTVRWQLHTNNGTLSLSSGSGNGSLLETGPQIETDTLYHLEIKLVQHASTGSIEVRLNGQTAILVTGLNTSATVGAFAFGGYRSGAATGEFYYDNLFYWDETAGEVTDFLGERNVYTLLPDGDGAETDWALSSGSDGYALINSVPPGSEYLESATVGDRSTFTVSDLPSTDINIVGVCISISGQKTGTETTTITSGILGHPGSEHALTQDQFLRFSDTYEVNPDTGEPWEPGEVDSIVVEIERTQ